MSDFTHRRNSPQVDHVSQRERDNDKHSFLTVDQERLMEMFYRLECSVSLAHDADVKDGNWNYIPYSHLRFYKTLMGVVKNHSKPVQDIRFLEMGCGLGTKLYIAAAWAKIGKVDGIEINPTYAEIARSMVNAAPSWNREIFCLDVRDFTRYNEYDLIYTYGEVRSHDGKVVAMVKEAMKPGAMLLQAYLSHEISLWTKPTAPLPVISEEAAQVAAGAMITEALDLYRRR